MHEREFLTYVGLVGANSTLCPAERKGKNLRWPIRCSLEEGHLGPHIAYGLGGVVVKRWANPEKQDMRRERR